MSTKIEIQIGKTIIYGELNNTPTARKIIETLPLEITMTRWGDEYYGNCSLHADLSPAARDLMEVGEIAFWPPGNALCIFFGPTPASTDRRPRAASDVNPVGKITNNTEILKSLGNSITVKIIKIT